MITEKDIWDLKSGADDRLTMVQLFKEPHNDNVDEDRHRRDCYTWCSKNLDGEGHSWAQDGVTVYSWRIIFESKEDAVAFKLTFGL